MKPSQRSPTWVLVAAIVIALAQFASMAVFRSQKSATIDEVAHLPAGVSHWALGRFELYAVNPPVVRLWAAIPTALQSRRIDWSDGRTAPALRTEFPVGKALVRDRGRDSQHDFMVARTMCAVFVLIGSITVFLWTRTLLGAQGGLVALLLWSFSPLILSHGSLLTPDVGATALGMLAIYQFRSWLLRVSWSETLLLGLLTGLALLTKFTWCIVLPLTAIIVTPIWRNVWRAGGRANQFRRDVVHLSCSSFIALCVVNCGYGFADTLKQLDEFEFVSESLAAHTNTEPGSQQTTATNRFEGTALGRMRIPLPACYIEGIDVQKRDFESGYRSYLMGEWKSGGWWYYYIVAWATKIPHATQLLVLCAFASLFAPTTGVARRVSRVGAAGTDRIVTTPVAPWKEYILLLTPPVIVFAAVSSQTGFNHHFRYVLPAMPFLYVLAARVVTLGRFWRRLTYVLLAWQLVSVVWHAPHWLSYFNEAAGGPIQGHRWLVDSNIDWGQDILSLADWQDSHSDAAPLKAALFAGFDPTHIGLKFELPPPFLAGQPEVTDRNGLRGPQPGWYAVSVCQLKGHHFHIPDGEGGQTASTGHYTYFQRLKPVERIGYSIYIYHVSPTAAAALRTRLLAEERAHRNDLE